MSEKVLVVKRKVLEEIGMFQGLCLETDECLAKIWSCQNTFFMDRVRAEDDPKYKQIIPFVIMSNEKSVLSYVRGAKGGEARLVEKISIGFGGHINPVDEETSSEKCMKEIYYNALFREIKEEIEVGTKFKDRIVGLINDDSNSVGQVHIGIVHHWSLEAQRVKAREQEIAQLKFQSVAGLTNLKEKMETWSQICYMHLNEML